MTLDVSLEAIEADLAIADRGGQVATIAMARAQVRATLLAAGGVTFDAPGISLPSPAEEPTAPQWAAAASQDVQVAQGGSADVFTVPKSATWEDRVTAAAMLLGIDEASLRFGLSPIGRLKEQEPALEPPAEPTDDDDDDDTEDVFAEARKARSKK